MVKKQTEKSKSIRSKSVLIIFFVEFINQLIDYPINCASLYTVCSTASVETEHHFLLECNTYSSVQHVTSS